MAYIKQLAVGIGSVSIRIEERNLMLREPHLIIHFETVEHSIIGAINLIRTEGKFKLIEVKIGCRSVNIIITDTSQVNRITNLFCTLNECNWQLIADEVIAMYLEVKTEERNYITQDEIHQFHMGVAEGIFPIEGTDGHIRYDSEYFNGMLERVRSHSTTTQPYSTTTETQIPIHSGIEGARTISDLLNNGYSSNEELGERTRRSIVATNTTIATRQPIVVSTPPRSEPRSFMEQIRRFERYIRTGRRDGED